MSNLNSLPLSVKSENDRVVGEVLAGIFRKDRIYGSRHMMRRPLGWALDIRSLRQAERLGADMVQLTDQETGDVYRASTALMKAKGVRFNRGFGSQICLPLEYWELNGRAARRASDGDVDTENVQLALGI